MHSPISTIKGTYSNWTNMSSSSVRDESSCHSGTRATRCFQGKNPPSEQLISENYYVGTRNHTPGPASYRVYASFDASVAPTIKTPCFGSGARLLSSSNSLHQPNQIPSNPGAGAYDVPSAFRPRPRQFEAGRGQAHGGESRTPFTPSTGQISAVGTRKNVSSTEQYLRQNLATAKARLRGLKEGVSSSTKMTAEVRKASERDYSLHFQRLSKKVEVLQSALDLMLEGQVRDCSIMGTGPERGQRVHARTVDVAVRPSFGSSERRPMQVPPKPDDAPTFYMSDAQWDFGTESRSKTIDMNAFGFSDMSNQFKEAQTHARKPILVGLKAFPPRCRETDFFGECDGERSITPGVGAYSPTPIPSTDPILKRQFDRASRVMTASSSSHMAGSR